MDLFHVWELKKMIVYFNDFFLFVFLHSVALFLSLIGFMQKMSAHIHLSSSLLLDSEHVPQPQLF